MNTPTKTQRAYRSKLSEQILSILEKTAEAYENYGDPLSDLRDAPEYFINVNLAQGLALAFSSLRYRLEHHATAYEDHANQEINVREALARETARFDVVLLNRSNNVPRYIIEVKRGVKILDDARRIISMAALGSGRRRWRHGFLVTILRRTEQDASEQMILLRSQIEQLRAGVSAELPAGQSVKVRSKMKRIGASKTAPDKKAIYGVVFQVTVIDKNVALDPAEQDIDES